MELIEQRDLIKDDLGNYYVVSSVFGKQVRLVNAVVYFSFNRILTQEFVEEVNNCYSDSVAVGQFFMDMVKSKIDGIKSGKTPGYIYNLNDVSELYNVTVDGLYERSVSIK